jgi:hypothetical protein
VKKLIKPQDINIEKLEQEVNALNESDCMAKLGGCGCYGFSKFWADDDNDDILL